VRGHVRSDYCELVLLMANAIDQVDLAIDRATIYHLSPHKVRFAIAAVAVNFYLLFAEIYYMEWTDSVAGIRAVSMGCNAAA
jgi:hypothetical protein